jgi:hypothetical protein
VGILGINGEEMKGGCGKFNDERPPDLYWLVKHYEQDAGKYTECSGLEF